VPPLNPQNTATKKAIRQIRAIRLIAINIFLLTLFLTCFSTCQKKSTPENQLSTLTFWVTMSVYEANAVRLIGERFAKETGIAIDVKEIGIFEITTKMELAAPAGKGPDLLSISHTSVGALALMNLISPFDINIDKNIEGNAGNTSNEILKKLEDYPRPLVTAFMFNVPDASKPYLYGVPLTVESYGLVINRALMDNPPKTVEELIKTAEELTKDTDNDGKIDTYGFLTDPTNLYFTFPFYDAHGAYIFEKAEGGFDTEDLGFCTAGGVSALAFVTKLTKKRSDAPALIPKGVTYPIISDLFKKGKVAAMIHGTYMIPHYRTSGIDVEYLPIPPLADGRECRPLSTLMGIAVSAHSENKGDALKFISFLLKPKNLRTYFEASGGVRVMANPDIYTNEDYRREPTLKTSISIAGNSIPFPNDPAGELVWDAFSDSVNLVLDGKTNPKDALCDMQERLKIVIKEMKGENK
jgi:maltose-binding protein MalE